MLARRVCGVCPLLLPSSPIALSYRGYIYVAGQDLALRLTIPAKEKLKNARLECDWRLNQMLKGKEGLLQQFLQDSEDEASFLLKFKNTLAHCDSLLPPPPPPSHYTQLLADLEQIGWQRVLHVSTDFTHIQIRTQDKKERKHIFTVHMAQQPPTILCDLPVTFNPSWSMQTTLLEILQSFEEQLSLHQVFWDIMDELDREAWVLEPKNPSPGCNYRRIVIGHNTSLNLTVDPCRPSSIPELKFLGPEHVVDPIRLKMLSRITQWDPCGKISVKQNLENLLDLKLPQPEASQQEGFSGECGICYAYHLEGVSPEMVCNNQHCTQPFHFACILEWLQTLPTTRQSFGTLFGECPYCNEHISIKLQ